MASASEDKDVSSIAPVGNKSKVKPEKAKPKTSRQVSNKLRQDVYPENKGKEVMQQYAEELKANARSGSSLESRSSSGDGGGKFPAQLQQRRHRNGELVIFTLSLSLSLSLALPFPYTSRALRYRYNSVYTSGGRCTRSPREVSFTGGCCCSVRYLFHWHYSSNGIGENIRVCVRIENSESHTYAKHTYVPENVNTLTRSSNRGPRTGRAPKRKSPLCASLDGADKQTGACIEIGVMTHHHRI
uniref:Uncharacterized protein n=1 Tax=Trichogramma kaykai TaxID=54128 RepID=A0ABD2VW46_9HYME